MLSQIFDPSIKFQIVPVFQQAIISVHHCSSGNTIKGLTFTAPIDVASCLFQQLSFTRFDPVHAHIGVYRVQFRLRRTLNIKKAENLWLVQKFNQGCMWARISLTWRWYLVQYSVADMLDAAQYLTHHCVTPGLPGVPTAGPVTSWRWIMSSSSRQASPAPASPIYYFIWNNCHSETKV